MAYTNKIVFAETTSSLRKTLENLLNMRRRIKFTELIALEQIFFGQAYKGYWWMPWHRQAKKDVLPAKSYGEPEGVLIRRCPNGGTQRSNPPLSMYEYIVHVKLYPLN